MPDPNGRQSLFSKSLDSPEELVRDTHIGLAHGNGGRLMRELIKDIFARHLGKDQLDVQVDAASNRASTGAPVDHDGWFHGPAIGVSRWRYRDPGGPRDL